MNKMAPMRTLEDLGSNESEGQSSMTSPTDETESLESEEHEEDPDLDTLRFQFFQDSAPIFECDIVSRTWDDLFAELRRLRPAIMAHVANIFEALPVPDDMRQRGLRPMVVLSHAGAMNTQRPYVCLVDLQFHDHFEPHSFMVHRHAYMMPVRATYNELLARFCLTEYCETAAVPCIITLNGRRVDHEFDVPMYFEQGMRIVIAIPPRPELNLPTLFLAKCSRTGRHSDAELSDLFQAQRHRYAFWQPRQHDPENDDSDDI